MEWRGGTRREGAHGVPGNASSVMGTRTPTHRGTLRDGIEAAQSHPDRGIGPGFTYSLPNASGLRAVFRALNLWHFQLSLPLGDDSEKHAQAEPQVVLQLVAFGGGGSLWGVEVNAEKQVVHDGVCYMIRSLTSRCALSSTQPAACHP